MSACLGAGAIVLAASGSRAMADEPGPDAIPVNVLSVSSADADDQAEALTKALRASIRVAPGWSLGTRDDSLEVLSIEMKCAKPPTPPDASCESRIADQIKVDRYIWGIITKKGATVVGELHLWERGKGSSKVPLKYNANLTEPDAEALKKVAEDALDQLTSGPPKGWVHVKAGNVGGQVFIDGVPVGAISTGDGTFPLGAGAHRIVVKAPGYLDAETQVSVKPNAITDTEVALVAKEVKSEMNARRIGGFVGIGAGVAFGLAGMISSLEVNGVKNDPAFQSYASQYVSSTDVCTAAKNRSLPDASKGERATPGASSFDDAASSCSKAQTFQVLQFVFYGLAAVSGGTGIYLLATSPGAPKTGLTVSPRVAAGSGRLDLTYRW